MERAESGRSAHQQLEPSGIGALEILARLRARQAMRAEQPVSSLGPPRRIAQGEYSRVERRWEMRLFGAVAIRTNVVETRTDLAGGHAPPAFLIDHRTAARRGERRARYIAGGVLCAALGLATMSLAIPSRPPDRPSSLLVQLPPPVATPRPSEAAVPREKARKAPAQSLTHNSGSANSSQSSPRRRGSISSEAPDFRGSEVADSRLHGDDGDVSPSGAPVALEQRTAVRSAMRRALGSGEIEPWSENGVEGVVVVGPPAELGGRKCRDVAILGRDGSARSETANSRKCIASDGSIANP